MLRVLNVLNKAKNISKLQIQKRDLLSPAYSCTNVWNHRLNTPILEKVNFDDLYHEVDQRYTKTGVISAVDVDIYANSLQGDEHIDEALDLIHKLRMSAETSNTLNSTHHAIVRYLLSNNRSEELLNVLDDRLNYGIFIDYYTANLLMDTFYEAKDYASGARTASQLMLQEECEHPISKAFALLHCYNFLLKPEGWPEAKLPEEPEEEVKIRVKYLRNPYDDQHFDLKDPIKITAKTLIAFTENADNSLLKSLHCLGLALFGKEDEARNFIKTCNEKLYSEILELLPAESVLKAEFDKLDTQSGQINNLLTDFLKVAERKMAEIDVAEQCKVFESWEKERKEALDRQIERLDIARRLDNIKKVQEDLKAREEKLWFFENEEQIELAIEKKQIFYPKRWFGKKKKPKKVDEGYVPPEIK